MPIHTRMGSGGWTGTRPGHTHPRAQPLELKRPHSEPLAHARPPVLADVSPALQALSHFPSFPRAPRCCQGLAPSRDGAASSTALLPGGPAGWGLFRQGSERLCAMACSREPCGFLARTAFSEHMSVWAHLPAPLPLLSEAGTMFPSITRQDRHI